jgi:hypothetical protein
LLILLSSEGAPWLVVGRIPQGADAGDGGGGLDDISVSGCPSRIAGQSQFTMSGAHVAEGTPRRDAIEVPFYDWLVLQQYIRAQPTWLRVGPDLSGS